MLEPSGLARCLVAEEDFAQEFGFAGKVDFDRCRRAGEGVAEDGLFHCERLVSRRELVEGVLDELHARLTINVFELLQAIGFGAGVEDDRNRRSTTVGIFELLQGVASRTAVRRGHSSLGLGVNMRVSSIAENANKTPGWRDPWGKVINQSNRSGKYGGAEGG